MITGATTLPRSHEVTKDHEDRRRRGLTEDTENTEDDDGGWNRAARGYRRDADAARVLVFFWA
jgi:hypothetical protein